MTLVELCTAIEAGYAAGKCGFDDDMIQWLIELGDRTAEIKALAERVPAAPKMTRCPECNGPVRGWTSEHLPNCSLLPL